MLTSLPLVQELHHPAMRERHWQQLMNVRAACKVQRLPFFMSLMHVYHSNIGRPSTGAC